MLTNGVALEDLKAAKTTLMAGLARTTSLNLADLFHFHMFRDLSSSNLDYILHRYNTLLNKEIAHRGHMDLYFPIEQRRYATGRVT